MFPEAHHNSRPHLSGRPLKAILPASPHAGRAVARVVRFMSFVGLTLPHLS